MRIKGVGVEQEEHREEQEPRRQHGCAAIKPMSGDLPEKIGAAGAEKRRDEPQGDIEPGEGRKDQSPAREILADPDVVGDDESHVPERLWNRRRRHVKFALRIGLRLHQHGVYVVGNRQAADKQPAVDQPADDQRQQKQRPRFRRRQPRLFGAQHRIDIRRRTPCVDDRAGCDELRRRERHGRFACEKPFVGHPRRQCGQRRQGDNAHHVEQRQRPEFHSPPPQRLRRSVGL